MILLRYGSSSSLSRSQSIGNVLDSFMSSISVSPLSFSSGQLDVPRVNSRRRLSNIEQFSDKNSSSSSSLSMPASRLDYRRHSASPEPLIQRLSGFSSDDRAKSGSSCEGYSAQFVEEEEAAANYNYLPKPFAKMNGHSSQDNQLQHHQLQYNHQEFLSLNTLGMSNLASSQQSTNLPHQHHHSSDHIDGNKLTFKGKGTRKISTDNSNLFTQNSNVQLLSSKKLPSLEKGLDVKWEVREGTNSCIQFISFPLQSLTSQEKRWQKVHTHIVILYCMMSGLS